MEILATVPVYTHSWIYNLLLLVATVIVAVGMMFCLMRFGIHSWTPILVGLILIIIGLFGASHATNAMERTSVLDYNTYKVTFDKTINAKDFFDKYEVISKEGEIFTIREIELEE